MSDTQGFVNRTFDGVMTSRYARCHNTISCPIDKTSRVTHNTYSRIVVEVALITPPTTFIEFHRSGTKSHYCDAGVAYKHNATTTKLSYFGSNQYKNKVSMVKLNVSHLLALGLKPYVELSSYT